MNKLIIENRTEMTDQDALHYVADVIAKGRISDNGNQYCYGTAFTDGVMVSAFKNKLSDRFVITRAKS